MKISCSTLALQKSLIMNLESRVGFRRRSLIIKLFVCYYYLILNLNGEIEFLDQNGIVSPQKHEQFILNLVN